MERVRHPEIIPLEVGDLWVDGGVLGEHDCYADFPPALRCAIEHLRAGRGATRSNGPLPAIVSGFEAVFLTGGRVNESALGQVLSGLECEVVLEEEGTFGGARGGFNLLAMRGISGWVVDLGQSHLKLITPQERWSFPRDFTRLRPPRDVSTRGLAVQKRRLREFIALKLRFAMNETGRRPEAIVFALPTRLADDGTPQGGDYAGMKNDPNLLTDALDMAGLRDVRLLVLNDAELAAFGAHADPRLAGHSKVLVLTVGFGVGAALIHRSRKKAEKVGAFQLKQS